MLTTETYTLDEAIAELDDRADTLEETLEDLDSETDEYEAIKARKDRVGYLADGLRWQRDEEGWSGDAEIELGAMTAGEKAMMHRDVPDAAEGDEWRLWFAAASTVSAPYADPDDDLEDVFTALAGAHPAFAEWVEAKANGLGIPGETGNGSSTSSRESDDSPTSTDETDSTTSSSSDSPTA